MGGEGRGGGGEVVYYIYFFYSIFVPPMLLPICRIPAFSISCRFPSVRGVCLDVAARRSPFCYYRSDVHPLSLCSMCHYFFLSLHLLHFFSFSLPLASILCPGFAQLVPVAHHSALPVSYCYSALPCPIHVSHLPLVSIVVAHAVCSHSLSRLA